MHSKLGTRTGVLVCVFALLTVGSATAQVSAASITSAELDQAMRLRQEWGFKNDPAYVLSVELSATSSHYYSIALTPAEQAEMERRGRIIDALATAGPAIEALPGYAGLYFDQPAGGVLDIALTSSAASLPDVTALLPLGTIVRFRQVSYTWADLVRVQHNVESAMTSRLALDDAAIRQVWSDPISNRVKVGVDQMGAELAARLAAHFGPETSVVPADAPSPTSCTSRLNCPSPWKGGVAIDGGGETCTSGFLGRPVSSFSRLYVLTAGHCIYFATYHATWYHAGLAIGTSQFHTFYTNSNADVGAINATESGAKNLVMASGISDIRSITGGYTNSQQVVGGTVCRAGRPEPTAPEYTCNVITATNQSTYYPNPGITIFGLWVANIATAPGQSGGSMIYGNTAMGVVSGANADHTWYSTIDDMVFQAGVRPCYTSACG